MRKLLLLIFTTTIVFFSCTSHREKKQLLDPTTHYTTLLEMQEVGTSTLCRIKNPWKEEEIAIQYLLVPSVDSTFTDSDLQKVESEYGEVQLLRTPLTHNAIAVSSLGYLLYQLDAISDVSLYCDAEYVKYKEVKALIDSGVIQNAGSSNAPNIEKILAENCNAIWISPFENANLGILQTIDIPIIYCADYMETTPLGRAEWMRFYGRLVDKASAADSLFSYVESNYIKLDKCQNLAKQESESINTNSDEITSSRKILLSELPYQATWYVPGGASSTAILYQDAGFAYPWEGDTHSGSLALSPELVLDKAQNCDLWIFKYYADNEWTLKDFLEQNPIYSQFKAAQDGNVYGCNTEQTDYFDVVPFRPDTLLNELVALSKDSLINDTYFKRLR